MAFNPAYFVNALSYLAAAITASYIFLVWSKKKEAVCKTGKIAGISGFFFFVMAFINFLWSFDFPAPSIEEFMLIKTAFAVIEASLLLLIVYEVNRDKRLFYLLSLFIVSVIAFKYSTANFFLISLITSYLLALLVSLDLVLFSNFYLKKAGMAGLFYSFSSLFFALLIYVGKNPMTMPWFIPNALMSAVFLFIFLDVKYCGIIKEIKRAKAVNKSLNLIFAFAKFIIFISSLTSFIFFSTIAVHELGHALSAQFYGCEYSKAVVYDLNDYPHTEIACSSGYSDFFVTISGLLLSAAIGLLFLFTGGESTKRMAYLILGFALLDSYGDLVEMNTSKSIIAIAVFSSLIVIGSAIIKLSSHYIERQKAAQQQQRGLNAISSNEFFILRGGRIIKDLYDLAHLMEEIDDETFKYHADGQKNDFAAWVKDVIKDYDLAKEILNAKSRDKTRLIILKRLINKKDSVCMDLAKNEG